MTNNQNFWLRHITVQLTVWCAAVTLALAALGRPVGPSDRPEAYFNGSSYIRLSKPISLRQVAGLSFRTCVGGELFSQRYEGHTLHVTALFEHVVVSWARPGQAHGELGLPRATLDNRWHWVALRYRPAPPALLLQVDQDTQLLANSTYNPELVSGGPLEAPGAVLLVGNLFSGCILEGPQLEFHPATNQVRNVVFGHCPLTTDECKDRKDVLRMPPKDHCYNEPCLRHGTCISRHDRYECHCAARYAGNNCEVDKGDPCLPNPCLHAGRCVEDSRGDYACLCQPQYHGAHCELEVSLDPLCVVGPCRNNGSCSVPPGSDTYVCACAPGYTGRNCETDVDECAGAVGACLNGGRCVDAVNNFTCDCTGTGYAGARCEMNVNECEEDRGVCGHGLCYDTYGGFVCACMPGYVGDHCHRYSPCASSPCGPGGMCVEEGASYRCVCARGWTGPMCTVPVSALPSTQPPAPLTCAELVCPEHSHCRDATAPGMPTPLPGAAVPKQAQCYCDPGYYGAPGLTPNCSTWEQACEEGVCLNGATCSLAVDHFNCTCAPGFKGAFCELAAGKALAEPHTPAPERCADAPCLHAVSCTDIATGFRCECEQGWGGTRCEVAAPAPAPLAAMVVDACASRPCQHSGTCRPVGDGFACECRAGFGGSLCETALDCRATGCPLRQACAEHAGGGWTCEAVPSDSACASSPCHNGTCLALDAGAFVCSCLPGYTGRHCEVEVDECAVSPKICNHGVCVNVPGSFQCYCRPGYTGDRCEQDIDECLSAPCKNGGSCQNLENNFECTCMDGFTGKDCSININECEASPCAAGSTCVDGIASYSCVCQQGLTGNHCEVDIDDCESEPCQHGGRCVDALNGYHCECAGTGYTGADCSLNIDECAPQPCRNGATCVDALNDYECRCHPGYTGKNCEVDVNECESGPCQHGGVCLERSNVTLYRSPSAGPLQVGPQPVQLLPALFYEPFALEQAEGFECVCVAGTEGARCEVNVDECASAPCGHGKCVDGVGTYSCECAPGYEGDHCQLEIDECLRYKPCSHGRCYDRRASYYCDCDEGWGGRNCSVVLEGCQGAPCRNNGTCLPWLLDELEHRFNCSCAPGHYGTTCEKITTMSLERSSYAEVNTSREEGYDISFRFKTTLGSGLLAMGRGLTYFFLELSNGRLNLHSSLLNKWEGVFIGSNLNDSRWQKVFVTINSSHLVLAANEEQTIYPISQNEAYNTSVTSFPSTRLGTAGSSYATLTHGPNFFVGCFQDVVVNGQWVLPEYSNASESQPATETKPEQGPVQTEPEGNSEGDGVARALLRGVLASCPRTPQCEPNPCRSGGVCEDYWTSFVCTCPRPHLGHTCQYNYTAATFGHEEARAHSVVAVAVWESARRAVHSALDISMFIRTRKPTGQIFYLGSKPRYGMTEETLVAASLKNGELLVHLRFNQTPEDYTVGGTRLDNGHLHLIQVVRNSTLVQVKLNGTEYFRKSISAAKQLDAQVLYLGGPPPAPLPPPLPTVAPTLEATAASTSSAAPAAPSPSGTVPLPLPTAAASTVPAPLTRVARAPNDADYFKGVIQDVQISNGPNVTIVEFFPLREPGLLLPPSFGEVTLDPAGVLPGERSDDACASRPCLHNATCTVTWNDYTCDCPRGYKGKQCAEVEFCQLQGCPLNSQCRNLDGGYECLSNATFDGSNTTLSYSLRVPLARAPAVPAYRPPESLQLTYRSQAGGTLLHAELPVGNETWWFSLSVFRDEATVQWYLRAGDVPVLRRVRKPRVDLDWSTLRFTVHTAPLAPAHPDHHGHVDVNHIRGGYVNAEGHDEASFSAPIDVAAWQRLMTDGVIRLGALRQPRPSPATTVSPVPVEGATDTSAWNGGEDWAVDSSLGEYFKGCMGAVHVGELLLPFFTEDELFVGAAAALLRAQPHYALTSGRAWGEEAGLGCVLCLERECLHGGRCTDVRHSYACTCRPGYAGVRCETDIDECLQHQCLNGATCRDALAAYTCECAPGFDGTFCEHDIDECASAPCANGGTCTDLAGGFECLCAAEWGGPRCERPRRLSCSHQPCALGRAVCRDHAPDPPNGNNYTCECLEGWEGVHCEKAFCEVRPCINGSCVTHAKTPMCECAPGYSGPYCEVERDECLEGGRDACLHGGHCIDQLNGFHCNCNGTGWEGARCERDVDECALGHVDCGPGECRNHDGGYTCQCSVGFCGNKCALPDPCYPEAPAALSNGSGPCLHGGGCEQRCSDRVGYLCHCVDGWAGANCSYQAVREGAEGLGGDSSTILIGVGAALVGVAALAGALGVLAAQARRKRATRGTYSPSGQEYCNPRAEMMHNTLKPPPEERLI